MIEGVLRSLDFLWSKEAAWTAGFALAVMLPFLIFVNTGWPGNPDTCLDPDRDGKYSLKGNTCFCEPFKLQDVLQNKPGVRQYLNTWSNMYIVLSALWLVVYVQTDRKPPSESSNDLNRMRTTDFYPIFYIQVAVFLALGSMWFHASIVWWGGIFDQMSMYTLVSFILAYSLVRLFNSPLYIFISLYGMFLILYFALAYIEADSQTVITISMIPYGIMEIVIWIRDWLLDPEGRGNFGSFWGHLWSYLKSLLNYWKFWLIAIGTFILAVILRGESNTGGPLCRVSYLFHGLWHVLCGLMAVMLYVHWRAAKR